MAGVQKTTKNDLQSNFTKKLYSIYSHFSPCNNIFCFVISISVTKVRLLFCPTSSKKISFSDGELLFDRAQSLLRKFRDHLLVIIS